MCFKRIYTYAHDIQQVAKETGRPSRAHDKLYSQARSTIFLSAVVIVLSWISIVVISVDAAWQPLQSSTTERSSWDDIVYVDYPTPPNPQYSTAPE